MKFRVARHTDNLEPIIKFYTEILGLEILGDFKNHGNYNGVFIGKNNSDWHLEFTKSNDKSDHKYDEDDLLVFYTKTLSEFEQIINRFEENNIQRIKPRNKYWRENGVMYLDPDGYGIIISQQKADKN